MAENFINIEKESEHKSRRPFAQGHTILVLILILYILRMSSGKSTQVIAEIFNDVQERGKYKCCAKHRR